MTMNIFFSFQYMHSLGILHCDLRPKNFLIDEYGILKVSDFTYARKVPKVALGDAPMESRGTPPYMAPELFANEGMHSFTSDFWALGCVLYELRRGVPPFGDSSVPVEELIERIRIVEPVESPIVHARPQSQSSTPKGKDLESSVSIPFSAALADILLWLLEKAPMNRCDW